jgi:hypothetical protein
VVVMISPSAFTGLGRRVRTYSSRQAKERTARQAS